MTENGQPEASPAVAVVLVTAPPSEAEALADRVVTERLAACVQLVGPIQSRYWWDGAVQSSAETLLILKTAPDRVAALQDRVVELHSYEVPEFVVFETDQGLAAYLSWVTDSTR